MSINKYQICGFGTKLFSISEWVQWAFKPTVSSSMILLQPLRWCCTECVVHHERNVR